MKRSITALAVGLLASLRATAGGVLVYAPLAMQVANTAAGAPTADQILDQYVQAVGGRTALEKLKTRIMKGSIELPATGETGTVQVYTKAPGKRLFEVLIASINGPTPLGFNGQAGWYVDPDEGLKDIASTDVGAMKREFIFNRELKLKSLYPRMVINGKEKVGGRESYVIQATTEEGTVDQMYFDTQTGLLLRIDTPYVTDDGSSILQTVFEDYREVDGVKLPFIWRRTSPDLDYVLRFESIQNNVAIDDSKFEKPAA